LTTAEFRLLTVFWERPRFVLSRYRLLDLTSGRAAQVIDRIIDNQISLVRRKIEADQAKPVLIATVWGAGYSLAADVRELPCPRSAAFWTGCCSNPWEDSCWPCSCWHSLSHRDLACFC
jgi:DNA-binding winged helix-turn-helix (wHTH) protein